MSQPTYFQKILFGSPGTGKSHTVDTTILNDLGIDRKINPENVIKTVFHPEYTYGDFMGKLSPITRNGRVEYKYYEGHFLRALAQAYKNRKAKPDSLPNVALIIDEINRGNSSAIFGTVFQLLDRNDDGWSSFGINISDIEFTRLFELIAGEGTEITLLSAQKVRIHSTNDQGEQTQIDKRIDTLQKEYQDMFDIKNKAIRIPPNLSIVATMNTSDSSIYYMDSAFKRRWDWEYIDIDGKPVSIEGMAFNNRDEWISFLTKLNDFIKSHHRLIRGIEDKQIGQYFIKGVPISKEKIQNKLMFFLWDSIFSRDKKPLADLLNSKIDNLVTFGDFSRQVDTFLENINSR